jgi:hypothetical protein
MFVFLDGEGAEATLLNVAAAMIVFMVAANVGSEQPHHVSVPIAVAARPEGEVGMVGHQARGEQTHGCPLPCLAQQLDEGGVIAVVVEDGAATIAAIEDMVAVAAQ